MPFGLKNPRYREKDLMVKDVLIAINLFRNDTITYEATYNIIHAVTYQWTQFDGMYIGNPKWSENALELYKDNLMREEKVSLSKLVREEHIVPRRIVIENLMYRLETNFDVIYNYLKRYLTSAIITIEEDKHINRGLRSTMPIEIETDGDFDEWARYRAKGIKVKLVEWQKKGRTRILNDNNVYLC